MKAKKKNRFLTFCFSCMPGAGEMYMGFLKTGLSLMSIFLLSVFGLSYFRFEEFAVVIGVTMWFYSFFHANHLASLTDEEFAEVKDGYLFADGELSGQVAWASKYQKVVAGLLIAAGIIMLWNTATDMARSFLPEYVWRIMYTVGDYVPRIAVAFLIIVVGVKLIMGRKAQLLQQENNENYEETFAQIPIVVQPEDAKESVKSEVTEGDAKEEA